ncbi:uncharacterized protein I303_103650 [Kwoniella dejecticola CBS 10117]|uniref:HTH APSES-type domain-containing protein n=1 Tax=Kwoniella dejecticola CBS 10117 TaxID=1296121 RepID=A0A1A6A7C4_9TREE|nr:uncharacterized protein I303_03671 [Kwoniella dejecticola CBS 10117]OBR85956.1 hypothetical protein I303_03671 [Kwoniella dejecticola CBS 10117]
MVANNFQQDDVAAFSTSVPPPPYSADNQYDLTPLPHTENRPRVPEEKRNPLLTNLPDDVKIVKFQTIVREGKEIVVGRIKVPTPGTASHAFILRRYDTNAISLTTMYKVAFPTANDEDERREMDWVKSSFDTRGTNGGRGSDVVRLAGQWVSRHLAIHLAPAYGLAELIASLARAVPDPNVAYRKSQRSQAATEEIANRQQPVAPVPAAGPVPSMTAAGETASPAPKRQRTDVSAPTASEGEASASTSTIAADGRAQREEQEQGEERHLTLEATTTVTAPAGSNVDMEAEIESAKQLVKDLKKELRLRAAVGEELEDQGVDVPTENRGRKRGNKEDEGGEISGGVANTKDRIVRKNKRVVQNGVLGETGQKIAWGTLIFGLGVGAATLLPQYVSNFF